MATHTTRSPVLELNKPLPDPPTCIHCDEPVTGDTLPCQEDFLKRHIIPCHRRTGQPTSETDCGICLEKLMAGQDQPRTERVVFLKPCKHFFHKSCIMMWHTSIRPERDTCPICRRVL
jgi:hypothetical protein